jgi:hypothetical protein
MDAWRERDAAQQAAMRRRRIDRRGWVFTAIVAVVMVVVCMALWLTW